MLTTTTVNLLVKERQAELEREAETRRLLEGIKPLRQARRGLTLEFFKVPFSTRRGLSYNPKNV